MLGRDERLELGRPGPLDQRRHPGRDARRGHPPVRAARHRGPQRGGALRVHGGPVQHRRARAERSRALRPHGLALPRRGGGPRPRPLRPRPREPQRDLRRRRPGGRRLAAARQLAPGGQDGARLPGPRRAEPDRDQLARSLRDALRRLARDAPALRDARADRAERRHGADRGRDGDGQGGGVVVAPRGEPARGGALRDPELRRDPRDAPRERALRPRARRLHRGRSLAGRDLRARPRRDPLPRRDRGAPARHAAATCARR